MKNGTAQTIGTKILAQISYANFAYQSHTVRNLKHQHKNLPESVRFIHNITKIILHIYTEARSLSIDMDGRKKPPPVVVAEAAAAAELTVW